MRYQYIHLCSLFFASKFVVPYIVLEGGCFIKEVLQVISCFVAFFFKLNNSIVTFLSQSKDNWITNLLVLGLQQ